MATQSFFSSLLRLRIMPVTMAFMMLLFMVKLYDVAQGTNRLSQVLIAGDAVAVEDELAAEDPAAVPEKETAKEEEKKPSMEKVESKKEKADDVIVGGNDVSGEEKESGVQKDIMDGKRQYSPVELELLQSLSKRRAELDKYQEEVRMKESLLDATELRINKKLDELKQLQAAVQKILDQYKSQEDTNIRSLVKMYENMKPKSAAQIFNEMEMPVLLLIVDRMSERKAAPILAAMDPKKAKELTIELAEERKVLDSSEEALKDVR